MTIWTFQSGYSDDFTAFTLVNWDDMDTCTTNGQPRNWPVPIQIVPGIEKKKKNQKPLGDINGLTTGGMILNSRAFSVLKDFLEPFGQLLKVEALNRGELLGDSSKASEIQYFYNVTKIISCIDYEKSEKRDTTIIKPYFYEDMIPKGPHVFKDPQRLRGEIHLNDLAKEKLSQLISDAGLTGAEIIRSDQNYLNF